MIEVGDKVIVELLEGDAWLGDADENGCISGEVVKHWGDFGLITIINPLVCNKHIVLMASNGYTNVKVVKDA